MTTRTIAAALFLTATGCAPAPSDSVAAGEREPTGDARVRLDAGAPLNVDGGWAEADGTPVAVAADRPFRLRFEASPPPGARLGLLVRRNGGPWERVEAHDFPYPERATPRVSIVSSAAYAHGAPTDDLLAGSALPFRPGAGVSLEALSPAWGAEASAGGHGEWAFPVVVRRYADGPVQNEAGDRFEFRLVDAGGTPVRGAAEVTVTLTIPEGHLGGTFVETPGRIGPWQAANGDLYFIMEPAETDNVLMVVKSSDGGATWREVDGTNRPAADDLEGVGAALHAGTLHVLHQTSDHVWHHAFHLSGHPTAPDSWAFTDEMVAAPAEPPTQVASLAARPDGSLVAAYGGPETVLVKTRSPDGVWSEEIALDPGDPVESGPHLAAGTGGAVHLAYTDQGGAAWYRRILPDGTPTPRIQITDDLGTAESDVGAVLPLVVLASGAAVVLYRTADGYLWERRVEGDAASEAVRVSALRVVQNAVDSEQAGADAIADGEAVHVLLIEDGTGHLYHVQSREAGTWSPPQLVAGDVEAQWVRGMAVTGPDGRRAYGYVVDAGSDGGAGMNCYGEVPLGR